MKEDGNMKDRKKSKFEVIANSIKFFPKREPAEHYELNQVPPEEYTDLEPF